jgi:hypothetical protein
VKNGKKSPAKTWKMGYLRFPGCRHNFSHNIHIGFNIAEACMLVEMAPEGISAEDIETLSKGLPGT